MTLNYGWCKVNSDFNMAFEDSDFSIKYENIINPFALDTNIGFTLAVTKRTFTIVMVRFKTQADAESMLSKIQALQNALTPFKIEWQIASGGAAGDFFAFDGTTRSMLVLCDNIKRLDKPAKGDQTIYKVQQIVFKEASKS